MVVGEVGFSNDIERIYESSTAALQSVIESSLLDSTI